MCAMYFVRNDICYWSYSSLANNPADCDVNNSKKKHQRSVVHYLHGRSGMTWSPVSYPSEIHKRTPFEFAKLS